jgi:hypothetical protein
MSKDRKTFREAEQTAQTPGSNGDGKDTGGRPPSSLTLNSAEAARKGLTKLMRQLWRGEIEDVDTYRALIYGFSTLLSYFKHEDERSRASAIEERLSALEERAKR